MCILLVHVRRTREEKRGAKYDEGQEKWKMEGKKTALHMRDKLTRRSKSNTMMHHFGALIVTTLGPPTR
jgi:hypothetical protein